VYEFTVDGVRYEGTRVAYGDYGTGNTSHARSIVDRYPEGKQVTVYYMPGDPEECLLEPGLKAQAWFIPLIGGIFFTVGAVMMIFLPRVLRKDDSLPDVA